MLSAWFGAGPTGHAMIMILLSISSDRYPSSLGCDGRQRRLKFDVLMPDRPDNPRQFVGYGDCRFVVSAPRRDGHGPVLEARQTFGVFVPSGAVSKTAPCPVRHKKRR